MYGLRAAEAHSTTLLVDELVVRCAEVRLSVIPYQPIKGELTVDFGSFSSLI